MEMFGVTVAIFHHHKYDKFSRLLAVLLLLLLSRFSRV